MRTRDLLKIERIAVAVSALHIPFIAWAAMATGAPVLPLCLSGLAMAVMAGIGCCMLRGPIGHNMIGVSFMAQAALIVLALSGHPWQVDAHMYFFAALAFLTVFRSISVILSAAAFVAVHHVTLNFVASDFVYPGGANFGRLVMHALILVMEAGGLCISIRAVQRSANAAVTMATDAEKARMKAAREAEGLKQALATLEETRQKAEQTEAKMKTEREMVEAERQEALQHQAEVVEALAEALKRLSAGDLSCRIDKEFSGRYEDLRVDFNSAIASLQETLTTVFTCVQSMQTGSSEISTATDDLSRRTEKQAATLEETAAALDQITVTIRSTADNAGQANQVVMHARTEAERSGEIVASTVEAMDAISGSASQISRITSVIDEIAFQTNLLALNAGVEAARAGDAGKGFAVVATEVRALAQRSAEAAKEIEGLIKNSTTQVESGVALVGQAGEALKRIAGRVSDISNLMSEITVSTQEQATGISQVNSAVNQMDRVTQQNAAMVEQTTAASHTLAHESERLVSLVGRFTTSGGVRADAAAESGAGEGGNVAAQQARIADVFG